MLAVKRQKMDFNRSFSQNININFPDVLCFSTLSALEKYVCVIYAFRVILVFKLCTQCVKNKGFCKTTYLNLT